MSQPRKVVSGEVRYMYVMHVKYRKDEIKNHYFAGILLYDGRIFCEDIHITDPFGENWDKHARKNNRWYVLSHNMEKLSYYFFRKYPLTKNSTVFFSDTFDKKDDFLFGLFHIIKYGYKCKLKQISMMTVVRTFKHYLKMRNLINVEKEVYNEIKHGKDYSGYWRRMTKLFNRMYDNFLESKQCPWINKQSDLRLCNLSNKESKMFKFLFVLLFWCVVYEVERYDMAKYKKNANQSRVRKTNKTYCTEDNPKITEDGRIW